MSDDQFAALLDALRNGFNGEAKIEKIVITIKPESKPIDKG